MIALRSLVVCATAVAGVGCQKEATFVEPIPDYAAIHWVNAVPDTNQQDMRLVDIVSNAGLFDANFRGSNMFYQPIEAGSRTLRIFLSSSDPAIASQILHEGTLALTEGTSYTFIHAGFARGGSPARTGLLLPDAPPSADTSQVALRVIHAGAGLNNVDLWFVRRPVAGTDTLPDARTAANVAFGTATTYTAYARDVAGTDSFRIVVTAAGTKTPILAAIKAPPGAPAVVPPAAPANPIAGSRIGGSVLTAVIVPASVAGSQAPQGGAFTTPNAVYLVDRRPPNTVP